MATITAQQTAPYGPRDAGAIMTHRSSDVAPLHRCLAMPSDPQHTNLIIRNHKEHSIGSPTPCFEEPLT